MLKLVACLLLAVLGSPIRMPAQWIAARPVLKNLAQFEWKVRRQEGRNVVGPGSDRSMWSERLTPPLPQVWPPDGKAGYVVYAFAAGMGASLHDGEEVAAPWFRFQITGAALEAKDLGNLRRLGMQGVRPLNKDEAEVARTGDAAEQALVALTRTTTAEVAPMVKRYYCQWSFNNAVISSELRRLHPEFYKALGCGP